MIPKAQGWCSTQGESYDVLTEDDQMMQELLLVSSLSNE